MRDSVTDRDEIANLLSKAFEETCELTNCRNCEYGKYGDNCRAYLYADMILIAGFRKEKEVNNGKTIHNNKN